MAELAQVIAAINGLIDKLAGIFGVNTTVFVCGAFFGAFCVYIPLMKGLGFVKDNYERRDNELMELSSLKDQRIDELHGKINEKEQQIATLEKSSNKNGK